MPKSKVSAFFSVLLVFASGAAMGAVGYRLYVVKTVASSPVGQPPSKKKTTPEDYRKRVVAHLKDTLKLNDQQVAELQKIYDWQGEQFTPINKKYDAQIEQVTEPVRKEFGQQLEQIHVAAIAKVKAILTADQQPLYEKWLADRAADHKKHQQEQQQHGQGPHNDGHRPPPQPLP
jgi:uncharacterized membrane-anchored protein YhcB (DUF1043 family)